jgi:hypothetical protein
MPLRIDDDLVSVGDNRARCARAHGERLVRQPGSDLDEGYGRG